VLSATVPVSVSVPVPEPPADLEPGERPPSPSPPPRPPSPEKNGEADRTPYKPRKLVRPTQPRPSDPSETPIRPAAPPSGSAPPEPAATPPPPPEDAPPTPTPLPPPSSPPPPPPPSAPDAPSHHDDDGRRSAKPPQHRALEATKSRSRLDQSPYTPGAGQKTASKLSTPTGPAHPHTPLTPRTFRPRTADEELKALQTQFVGTTTLDSYDHGVKLGEGTFGWVISRPW
jgi:hypothetical protein